MCCLLTGLVYLLFLVARAMEVLDLLLTFQRNQRLKVFVTMFKQAEQGAAKRKSQSVLEPLLYEAYNPSDQKKYYLIHH